MKKICSLFCTGLSIFLFVIFHPSPVSATAPTISGINVSVTETTATVTWTTDQNANSFVDYGTTDDYNDTVTDSSYVTSHSLSISGLTKGTVYHYSVISENESQENSRSDDATFTTSGGSSSSSSTTTTTKIITATPLPTPTPDKVPPSVSLKTDFSQNYTEAPEIEGNASDVSGVVSLEYSIDNGKNWLPVEQIATIYGKSTLFSFSPPALFDGSYNIKIRSADGKGNTGTSKAYELTIDRLPPRVGSFLLKSGPLIFDPSQNNTISVLTNQKYSLFLSAVGGPNTINLYPHAPGQNLSQVSPVPMYPSAQSGIWQTELEFPQKGSFLLETVSQDGAKNITQKSLGQVTVLPAGQVLNDGKPLADVTVNLYFLNPITQKFVLFDGSSYEIKNPIKTDPNGGFSFFLPAGVYFLTLNKDGFAPSRTQIITLAKSSFINGQIELPKSRQLNFAGRAFSLPPVARKIVSLNQIPQTSENYSPIWDLIGKQLPDFTLVSQTEEISQFSLRSLPSLLVFLNTFTPQSSDILNMLEKIPPGKDYRIIVVFPQEPEETVSVYKNRGGYTLRFFADPDGNLLELLKINTLPTYMFIDRKGVITDIRNGILNQDEILEIINK